MDWEIQDGTYMIIYKVEAGAGTHFGILMDDYNHPFQTLDADEAIKRQSFMYKMMESMGVDYKSWIVQR